jgi:UDP-glucose 4-epimerase
MNPSSLPFRRALVTGAGGFIGSSLVDRLLEAGTEVVGYDNFSTGYREFLEPASKNPRFRLVEGDTLDLDRLCGALDGAEIVFHLAANADVRFGLDHPRKDLEQNTIATFNVLEAMRAKGVRRMVFSSTGSIYGEASLIPTPEDAPFPVQTSLYGASKLACEGLIQSYCEGFGLQGWIFRFVSILGERYTHGHVFDFFGRLLRDPAVLPVLGDGLQKKSYLYVQDCIDAVFRALASATDRINIFNLGTEEYCTVNDSIGWITNRMGVKPQLAYSGGKRGWVGDNPFIFLDTQRIRALGWRPRLTIAEGIVRTLDWLSRNPWVFDLKRQKEAEQQ